MAKAAVFLADGFEEVEAIAPIDLLRRGGVEVTTVSIMGRTTVHGSHNIDVTADTVLEAFDFAGMDMLVLPGGGLGTKNLKACAPLLEKVKEFDAAGKYIAAICAAPRIAGRLGFLKGKKATCYPGNEVHLEGADYRSDCKAVTDGKMITARGMGASIEFGAQIIAALEGEEKAQAILDQIQF